MGKKGKGKKASTASALSEKSKGGKGKKGKKGKGKKGKPVEEAAPVVVCPEPEPLPPPPEPEPKCKERVPMGDPCRYTDDACCKDALACKPNRYPGLMADPLPMAVVGSENGTYDSLCKLLRTGFRCADRVFAMTPWGNYVVIKSKAENMYTFFLFDGCTCNVNRFRYLDLNCGTAGFIYFEHLHDVITYIIESRQMRHIMQNMRRSIVDDICHEFCEYNKRE